VGGSDLRKSVDLVVLLTGDVVGDIDGEVVNLLLLGRGDDGGENAVPVGGKAKSEGIMILFVMVLVLAEAVETLDDLCLCSESDNPGSEAVLIFIHPKNDLN
jgi:hypothetical protein